MTETDEESGQTTCVSWPRASVAEMRPNRFQKSLWIRVSRETVVDVLEDQPAEVIERVGAALAEARGRLELGDVK